MRVSVLGAGNGGFATAAHLTQEGHQVTLFELAEFGSVLDEVMEQGGIELEALPSSGIKGGFVKLAGITTNIEEALHDAEIVFVTVPAFGHKRFAELCAPHLKNGQIVILAPGSMFGSLEFAGVVRKHGNMDDILFAEMDSMMYACRKKDAKSVWIRGYKNGLGCGVFPAKRSDEVIAKLNVLYPSFKKRDNVLASGASNTNSTMHIPIMLFNIGNVEAKRDLLFYGECLTPSIGKYIEAIDNERTGFARANLFFVEDAKTKLLSWYGHQGAHGNTLWEAQSTNPIYPNSKLPADINNRYLTEDVPYGLIPIASLLELFGLPHEVMDLTTRAACILCDRDFHQDARTLDKIGLGGITGNELLEYVQNGN